MPTRKVNPSEGQHTHLTTNIGKKRVSSKSYLILQTNNKTKKNNKQMNKYLLTKKKFSKKLKKQHMSKHCEKIQKMNPLKTNNSK